MITKFQIFESFKIGEPDYDTYFYHTTRTKHLPSIVKYGLTPNIDRETHCEGDFGQWSKGKVFVTENIYNAQYYGNIIMKNYSLSWIPILRFKIPENIKLKPDLSSEFNEESCSPDDWYSQFPIITNFEIKDGKKWIKLTKELADDIAGGDWDGEKIEYIDEGLISTSPTKKTVKILKRKFPDYYVSILPDGEIEISAGRKDYVDNIVEIENICKQIGWYISHGTEDGLHYKFDKEFLEHSFDDVVIKQIFDSTRDIDIKPSIMYHVTPVKNINKILKIGLVPKHKDKITYHPDRVYLTDELELAWGLKKEFERINGYECQILKILTNDLDIKLYSDVDSRQYGFYTLENIPPRFISILPKEEYRKHWLV